MRIILTIIIYIIALQFHLFADSIKELPLSYKMLTKDEVKKIENLIDEKASKYKNNPFKNVEWPDEEEIKKYSKLKIYSKEYLKKNYLENISYVKIYCVNWLNEIFNSNYIPEDVKDRLQCLQYKNPRKSKVILRYNINDINIQMLIKVSSITVIINPIDKFYIDGKFDYKLFFKTIFTKDGLISKYKKEIYHPNKEQNSNIYRFNAYGTIWYNQLFWYVNKDSIVLSIPLYNGCSIPRENKIWF